ncbi:hypothetical protein JCM10213_005931 [Rhodosporidiobolus nylandii]
MPSSATHSGSHIRRRRDQDSPFQPFPTPSDWSSSSLPPGAPNPSYDLLRARTQARTPSAAHSNASRTSRRSRLGAEDTASESGMSVLSAFAPQDYEAEKARRKAAREKRRAERAARELEKTVDGEAKGKSEVTDSPLRRWSRWVSEQPALRPYAVVVAVLAVVLVKWCVGLGGYSGFATPPLRGDFEAQRHWLALTSSSLNPLPHVPLLPFLRLYRPSAPSSNATLAPKDWYYHDHPYWGLDYPPLTAFHSLLLGAVARLSPRTAEYVTLRPHSTNASAAELAQWEAQMARLESEGGLRNWMRGTVIVGDVIVWVSAVLVYVRRNYAGESRKEGKALRRMLVASLTILLQPALILIDSGHFQYNSLMLGLTLHALNFFQRGNDILGAVCFVASLGFKQMALYYAPGVFAYLLGKCFWLGRRRGLTLFLHLSLVVLLSFALLFSPFLAAGPPVALQAVQRIFPFARGLFEDKVANAWCALNVLVKLRELASVPTLAKLALAVTALAVAPSSAGAVWVSWRLRDRASASAAGKCPAPTANLLPHLLLLSSLAFFLFSFQVHEKSILLPLMPLTLLMGGREAGYGRMDWEWGVLVNNVAVFSMWPLLQRDGVQTQYLSLTVLWNWALGYNPLSLRPSFVKYLSLASYTLIFALHTLEALTPPPPHLPDLFPVLNLTLSAGVFGLAWLWAGKRFAQEAWALVGLGR